jgi:hypothetical protein
MGIKIPQNVKKSSSNWQIMAFMVDLVCPEKFWYENIGIRREFIL